METTPSKGIQKEGEDNFTEYFENVKSEIQQESEQKDGVNCQVQFIRCNPAEN